MRAYEEHLIRDKRFWPIFWTQFSGAFNDNVFKNALVILITYKSFTLMNLATEQMVALCGGIFILPFFLFSAMAGQLADKISKSRLMVWIKIWEIGVMSVGAIGFYLDNIVLLLITLFMMGLQSTFFGPVKYSVLPELINDDELVQGNALVEMGTFLSILLGTILGGLLIGQTALNNFMVGCLTIVIAIIGTLFAKSVTPLASSNPELKVHYGLIRPTWNIIKIAKEVKSIWNSILGICWFWCIGAALLSMFPVYVKDILYADQKVVTLFLAMFSVGVACGSMLCEKLSRQRLELGLVPFGSLGMTLFMIDLYIVGRPDWVVTEGAFLTLTSFLSHGLSWRILFDLFFLSVFSGFFIVPLYTHIQHRSKREVRSRIIAANNILNAFFMVLTSVVMTFMYGLGYSVVDLFLFFGILNTIVAVYIYTVIPEFMLRFACMIVTRILYRLRTRGLEHIPDEGPAILVANHISFIDWLVIAAAVKRPIRFVMYYKMANLPLLRLIFRDGKVIPIAGKREDPVILQQAMDKIDEELQAGHLVCIFPEGMITHDGKLNGYRPGIERIIAKRPVPVIPMTIEGLWGSYFSRKYGRALSNPMAIFKKIWTRIYINITPALKPEYVTAKKLEELARVALKR